MKAKEMMLPDGSVKFIFEDGTITVKDANWVSYVKKARKRYAAPKGGKTRVNLRTGVEEVV